MLIGPAVVDIFFPPISDVVRGKEPFVPKRKDEGEGERNGKEGSQGRKEGRKEGKKLFNGTRKEGRKKGR